MKLSIDEQLARIRAHTVEIIPEEELVKKLRSGRPLRVKLGVDPTGPDIHLGHAVVLRKLRLFQDLGHVAVLIIGDFTGMIGDPSGRSEGRPQLTREQVDKNVATYREQVFTILDPEKTEFHYNSEWCSKLTPEQILRLASTHTVAQMLARDDFEQRYKAEQPISIHELLYPIFQGYDSVAIRSDIELGGTEQKFNLLVGRELQRDELRRIHEFLGDPSRHTWHQVLHCGNAARVATSCSRVSPSVMERLRQTAQRHGWSPSFGLSKSLLDQLAKALPESGPAFSRAPGLLDLMGEPLGQVIITFPILVGTDGVRRMGKSLGNYIGVTESPDDMFGKIMSIPDGVMGDFFTLCTDLSNDEITAMLAEMRAGELNPRDAKRRLAKEIVTLYHGAEAAARADETFLRVFSGSREQTLEDYAALASEVAIPEDLRGRPLWASTAIHQLGLTKTKSEAARLVKAGAVHVDDRQLSDPQEEIAFAAGMLLRVGKRRVVRLV
jgi:tyrosyl-tRNA synthetase